jgi:tRNA A22 N-methylase
MQKKRYILKPFTIVVGMNKAYELLKAEKETEPIKKMIR